MTPPLVPPSVIDTSRNLLISLIASSNMTVLGGSYKFTPFGVEIQEGSESMSIPWASVLYLKQDVSIDDKDESNDDADLDTVSSPFANVERTLLERSLDAGIILVGDDGDGYILDDGRFIGSTKEEATRILDGEPFLRAYCMKRLDDMVTSHQPAPQPEPAPSLQKKIPQRKVSTSEQGKHQEPRASEAPSPMPSPKTRTRKKKEEPDDIDWDGIADDIDLGMS